MSLSIAVRVPEGIVLACDQRLTFTRDQGGQRQLIFLDAAQKVFLPGAPNPKLAVSFYGDAALGNRTPGDLIAEWSREQTERKPVETIARELHTFLDVRGLRNVSLCVAGVDDTAYFGRIFELVLPGGVTELHANGTPGLSLGGQNVVASTLVQKLEIPLEVMSLQGAADLASWLIDVTTKAQSFSFGPQGVGGGARVAVLERGKAAKIL